MDGYHTRLVVSLIVTLLVATILACAIGPPDAQEEISPAQSPIVSEADGSITPEAIPTQPAPQETPPTTPPESGRSSDAPSPTPIHPPAGLAIDKWGLWVDGPHLRGANIYQRHVYPELDGPEFMGPGPLGPPYTQESFDRLAALGANYVNISHPGLFSESPPYGLDKKVQDNLDQTLDMIARADMFAVISFRTGPGRAEFSVCCFEEAGDWYDKGYLNDTVWQDSEAQEAWAAMWRHTAERFRDNPIVVGYDLMVEPNANEVWMDVWDQEEFYADYGGTLYDWNQLYPRITAAIREVDPDTPIIVGGMAYSAVDWLPYLEVTDDPRTVYAAHQYAPFQYTHQWPDSLEFTYPGVFDTDWDDIDDQFNRAWLEELLSTVDDFVSTHGVPVAINEFGLMRWQPGGAEFMDDQMALFEERGINYALWAWETSWEPFAEEVHAFNFRLGPDPDNLANVTSSDLMDVIRRYWGRNSVRPSSFKNGSTAPTSSHTASERTPSEAGLIDVSHWLYLIDVNLEPEMVTRIAASEHDMVVLDFIPSEENNTDYPMTEVIDQLHNAPHPKLVIAYLDIGQAEEYRTYWQPGWGIGDPEWIVGADPDSTPHVSSEEYLRYLTAARDKGEIIFTVDYASDPENVAWVYQTSRTLGFVPLVGNRALDRYVEPVPFYDQDGPRPRR